MGRDEFVEKKREDTDDTRKDENGKGNPVKAQTIGFHGDDFMMPGQRSKRQER